VLNDKGMTSERNSLITGVSSHFLKPELVIEQLLSFYLNIIDSPCMFMIM